jgi:BirA family biotin operon repressor/biotin-[acetyl-CoA-carboxylase] ligase
MFKKYAFAEVSSTNDIAKVLLEHEPAVIVTAENQTKGKGRNGKTWFGKKGESIMVTFGFKTEKGENNIEISKYQMLGSLAIVKVLREVAPNSNFKLKYPNDVLAQNGELKGKISGVLCEHEFMGMLCYKTLIGMGINVSQKKFTEIEGNIPVSLKMLNVEIAREVVMEKLEEEMKLLLKLPRKKIQQMWETELDMIGKNITTKDTEGIWTVEEFLPDGRIKAFKNQESRIIDNGDSIRYI